MFVTKHHVAPVALDIGLGEPQSAALVGFLLFKSVSTSTMHCSLVRSCSSHRRPSVSSVPLRFRDASGVFSSTFFFPQSAPHSSKASLAAQHAWHRQSEPESLHFSIQRFTKWWSNPVL